MPVVNPDGYEFNHRIYDSTATFGFWRKNLRDNNGNHVTDSGDGVDLNRNYGYQWGFDNVGSSPTREQRRRIAAPRRGRSPRRASSATCSRRSSR